MPHRLERDDDEDRERGEHRRQQWQHVSGEEPQGEGEPDVLRGDHDEETPQQHEADEPAGAVAAGARDPRTEGVPAGEER